MLRLCVVALLAVAGSVQAAERATDELYRRSCAVCHASGAAGAPRTGVASDWQGRASRGDPAALLKSVKQGLKAMPPKGMCFDCSDEEFLALIDFMVQAR